MRLEKSEDLDNVYKLFGECAHHCSNIECSLALLLHPARWKKHSTDLENTEEEMQNKLKDIKQWAVANKKFDEALDNVEQDIDSLYKFPSCSKLVKWIKEEYSLLDEQAKYLNEICNKRNYVIHRIWWAYGRRLKNPAVIKEMLIELQGYEKYFSSASDWLQKQAYSLNGVSEEMLIAKLNSKK